MHDIGTPVPGTAGGTGSLTAVARPVARLAPVEGGGRVAGDRRWAVRDRRGDRSCAWRAGWMDPADDGRIFILADMECADGDALIGMVGTVPRRLRRRLPSRPLRMVCSDLPRNDAGARFRAVLVPEHLCGVAALPVFGVVTPGPPSDGPAGRLSRGFRQVSRDIDTGAVRDIRARAHGGCDRGGVGGPGRAGVP